MDNRSAKRLVRRLRGSGKWYKVTIRQLSVGGCIVSAHAVSDGRLRLWVRED